MDNTSHSSINSTISDTSKELLHLKSSSSLHSFYVNSIHNSNSNISNELVSILDKFNDLLKMLITEYHITHADILDYINECILDYSCELQEYTMLISYNGCNYINIHDNFKTFLIKNQEFPLIDIKKLTLLLTDYGECILNDHPKLKEILYIYESNYIEMLSSRIRNIIELQRILDNMKINKEYIKTLNEKDVFGNLIANVSLLYYSNCEFISIINNYTYLSIISLLNTNEEPYFKASILNQKISIKEHYKHENIDIMYNDIIKSFVNHNKWQWFKRNGPFFDLFNNKPYNDPGMWNSQNIYDSLGIQYLIEKAYEKEVNLIPIDKYDKNILNNTYLKFGIICGLIEHSNIGICKFPHYYDFNFYKGDLTIITKIK